MTDYSVRIARFAAICFTLLTTAQKGYTVGALNTFSKGDFMFTASIDLVPHVTVMKVV